MGGKMENELNVDFWINILPMVFTLIVKDMRLCQSKLRKYLAQCVAYD